MEHTQTTNSAVAAELRASLARRSMTQRQLAQASGMSSATLNAKLRGHRAFTVDELFNVASVLDLSPAAILSAATTELGSQR